MWGWEPTTTTTYTYDEAGRLLEATTVAEPEFDADQLDLLRAGLELEKLTGRYGEDLTEALSPDSDPNNRDAPYRYVAGVEVNGEWVPYTNWAEKAVGDAQDRYYKRYPDANRNGHYWPVHRIEK